MISSVSSRSFVWSPHPLLVIKMRAFDTAQYIIGLFDLIELDFCAGSRIEVWMVLFQQLLKGQDYVRQPSVWSHNKQYII